jgi:hypothetical protein
MVTFRQPRKRGRYGPASLYGGARLIGDVSDGGASAAATGGAARFP